MTEAKITKKAVDALRKRGMMAVKIHGGPHQPAGLPDICGCYRSIFVGLEMKMPGKEKTLTPRQDKKLRDIKKAGGIAVVCTSVAQCEEVLDKIDRRLNARRAA